MRKNRFSRYSLIFCVIIYAAFSFAVYADAIGVAVSTPNANQPDMSGTIKELNIVPNFAILEGQTLQMKTDNPIYFYMDLVKNGAIKLNMDCSAVNNGFSFYYYGYSPKDDE